jgi:hypothetical protein
MVNRSIVWGVNSPATGRAPQASGQIAVIAFRGGSVVVVLVVVVVVLVVVVAGIIVVVVEVAVDTGGSVVKTLGEAVSALVEVWCSNQAIPPSAPMPPSVARYARKRRLVGSLPVTIHPSKKP